MGAKKKHWPGQKDLTDTKAVDSFHLKEKSFFQFGHQLDDDEDAPEVFERHRRQRRVQGAVVGGLADASESSLSVLGLGGVAQAKDTLVGQNRQVYWCWGWERILITREAWFMSLKKIFT